MGLFENKNELLIDADIGLVGTLVGFEEEKSEKGFVYPIYVPLNSFPPRKIKYKEPVPLSAIHETYPTRQDIKGVEKKIVWIIRGGDDSILKLVDKRNLKKIEELQERIKDLEIEAMNYKQMMEDALSGVAKQVAKTKELTGKQEPSSPFVNRYYEMF